MQDCEKDRTLYWISSIPDEYESKFTPKKKEVRKVTTVEATNIENLGIQATAEGKKIVKTYRAYEGDLRIILESADGTQERWSVSRKEPYKI